MGDGRTLLLLGAGGFAGRHVGAAAEEAGFEVVRASRDGGGADLACDLLDPASIRAALETARPAHVANLAGSSSVAASWRDPEATFAVNATGVESLLEAVAAAAPGAHVLCVSSAQVYGTPAAETLPLREEAPADPVTPYGESKVAMESVCARFAREGSLRVAVLRPFNLVGPGQAAEFSASGFARAIAAAEARGEEEAELAVGNPAAARDFVDVRDAAVAFAAVAERELTGTFNLCSGRPTGLREMIREMAEATPLPVRIEDAPDLRRPADPPISYGSPDRLRAATGWSATTPLARTVADLIDWWRATLDQGGAGPTRPR